MVVLHEKWIQNEVKSLLPERQSCLIITVCVDSLVMILNDLSQKFYFGRSQSETKSGTKSETKSECFALLNFHDLIPLLPH